MTCWALTVYVCPSYGFTHLHINVAFSTLFQQSLLLKILGNYHYSLLHARLLAMDVDLRLLRSLVRRTDASELLDLSCTSLLVQTLRVALLGLLNRDVDEDLDERERRLGVLSVDVHLAGELSVGFVGRDEGGDGYAGGVCEELGNLRRRSISDRVCVV